MVEPGEPWPKLPYADWAPTKRALHMVTQMVGKTRLGLAPPQPEWLHACLYLSPRGLTTGAMPVGTRAAAVEVDLLEPAVVLQLSDGRVQRVEVGPGRSVADIWHDYQGALRELEIDVEINETPQEVANPIPFSEDRAVATVRAADTRRFHRLLTSVNAALEAFRSPFFGRSGIQFWWGSFDFCAILFTGRHVPAPTDRGYIMRHDLDAEHLNAGFWPGADGAPDPQFFAYLVPEPADCATAPMSPSLAAWADQAHEWILPYETARRTGDAGEALLAFLARVQAHAYASGGWDEDAFRYELPRRRARRSTRRSTPGAR